MSTERFKVYDVYNAFGYFHSNRQGVLDISLPKLEVEFYEYYFLNISNHDVNGLVVNIKRSKDDGTPLTNPDMNFESVLLDLDNVDIYTQDGVPVAVDFNYNKPFVVITYHSDTLHTPEFWLNAFNELKGGGSTGTPATSGSGVLKKM